MNLGWASKILTLIFKKIKADVWAVFGLLLLFLVYLNVFKYTEHKVSNSTNSLLVLLQ